MTETISVRLNTVKRMFIFKDGIHILFQKENRPAYLFIVLQFVESCIHYLLGLPFSDV